MTKPDPKLEIVTVFESDDMIAFELAKQVLDEAGVDYFVHEDPPARFGFSPFLNPLRRILMPASRKEEVQKLIANAQTEYESDADEDEEGDGNS